jgi:hypothetical protein
MSTNPTRRTAAGLAAGVLIAAVSACTNAPTSIHLEPTRPASTCATSIEVRDSDNGRAVCLAPGGTLRVYLGGEFGPNWGALKLTGNALAEVSPPPQFPAEIRGGVFTAVRPGQARVTTEAPACPAPTPGEMGCDSVRSFMVTVTVG